MVLDLAVLNPEKTIITYRLASLGGRIMAHLVDLLILVLVVIGLTVASFQLALMQQGFAVAFLIAAISLGPFLYFILLEALWNGQTIGKRLMGIRVRMADGTPITFAAAMGRNLLRVADFLPSLYLVGLVAMFTNPRSQRLGDMVANTVVLNERRDRTKLIAAPHTAGVHAFEHAVGDLPGMTLDEYVALRRYCDRFPELPPAVQDHLTETVWRPIAARRKVAELPDVHPIYLAEAAVMKYGRKNGLL